MAAYCGIPANAAGRRTLEASAHVAYPVPADSEPAVLPLRYAPIPVSDVTVRVDELWVYGTDTLVDEDDYLYDAATGNLYLRPTGSSSWSASPRGNQVSFTAGYDLTTVDAEDHPLVSLVALTVQALLDRPHSQGRANSTIGGQSMSTSDADQILPAAVRAALDSDCVIWSRRVA